MSGSLSEATQIILQLRNRLQASDSALKLAQEREKELRTQVQSFRTGSQHARLARSSDPAPIQSVQSLFVTVFDCGPSVEGGWELRLYIESALEIATFDLWLE